MKAMALDPLPFPPPPTHMQLILTSLPINGFINTEVVHFHPVQQRAWCMGAVMHSLEVRHGW